MSETTTPAPEGTPDRTGWFPVLHWRTPPHHRAESAQIADLPAPLRGRLMVARTTKGSRTFSVRRDGRLIGTGDCMAEAQTVAARWFCKVWLNAPDTEAAPAAPEPAAPPAVDQADARALHTAIRHALAFTTGAITYNPTTGAPAAIITWEAVQRLRDAAARFDGEG